LTDDADLQPAVAAEFLALADLLDAVPGSQWDTPSLCEVGGFAKSSPI